MCAQGVEAFIVAGSGYGTPRTYEYPPDATGRPDLTQGPILHCADGDSVATAESLTGGVTVAGTLPPQCLVYGVRLLV
jgi:hypothetical protein